jgi:hypothetical protein
MPPLTTISQTSRLFFLHWFTGPKLSVIPTVAQKLKFLHNTFQNNGYSERQILWALNPPKRAPLQRREDPTSVAFLPSVGTTFNVISRVLSKQNIKTVGLLPRKLSSFLHPIRDDMTLKTPGVYSIPCECGKV